MLLTQLSGYHSIKIATEVTVMDWLNTNSSNLKVSFYKSKFIQGKYVSPFLVQTLKEYIIHTLLVWTLVRENSNSNKNDLIRKAKHISLGWTLDTTYPVLSKTNNLWSLKRFIKFYHIRYKKISKSKWILALSIFDIVGRSHFDVNQP